MCPFKILQQLRIICLWLIENKAYAYGEEYLFFIFQIINNAIFSVWSHSFRSHCTQIESMWLNLKTESHQHSVKSTIPSDSRLPSIDRHQYPTRRVMCVLHINVIANPERKEPKGKEDVEYRETNGGRERRRKTDGWRTWNVSSGFNEVLHKSIAPLSGSARRWGAEKVAGAHWPWFPDRDALMWDGGGGGCPPVEVNPTALRMITACGWDGFPISEPGRYINTL